MSPVLEWTADPDGVRFSCFAGKGFQPWGEWARLRPVTTGRNPANVGPLVRLLQEADASPTAQEPLIAHEAIASLVDEEVLGLGLPARPAYTVELKSHGSLQAPEFRFRVALLRADGRPLMQWSRRGVFLTAASQRYTLGEPLFSLLEGIDRFHAAPPSDPDERFRAWAELRQLVPSSARLDAYLTNLRVTVATGLALRRFKNSRGEEDFDPVALQPLVEGASGDDLGGTETRSILDETAQQEFQQQFRRRSQVPSRFILRNGTFLVLEEPLRQALEVVHRAQVGAPEERRAFSANPRVFLREKLEAQLGEERLEALFWDAEYGERVREVSEWVPRPLPIIPSGQQWIPPAEEGEDCSALPESCITAADGQEAGATAPPLAVAIKDNLDTLEFVRPHRAQAEAELHPLRCLVTRLLPHQNEALAWLQAHWKAGSRGALLADDMGLGKTLSALAFVAWLRELMESGTAVRKPVLVVAPTGLLQNWRNEHDQHLASPGLGQLTCAYGEGLAGLRVLRGPAARELAGGMPVLNVRALAESDWVLATFEAVRDYQHSFARVKWAAVVLDEAQKVKNPATGLANAAKALDFDFGLALTGTPVENRLTDLWSIVDTVAPGPLGSMREFRARFDSGHVPGASAAPEALPGHEALRRALLEEGQPPLMKRRLKRDHLEGLPTKEYIPCPGTMGLEQAVAYEEVVASARRGGGGRNAILAIIQRLRSVSLHPRPSDLSGGDEAYIRRSVRLTKCVEVLDRVHERREKALVFTDSLELQATLAEVLQRRYDMASPPMLINGEVAGVERQNRVGRFQKAEGFDVMLLSPKAGGVGLTLTAANHVIHLSRWWNPAVEDQSTDRVYRIGQRRPVSVYLPLAVHPRFGDRSFDLRLHELLETKRRLSEAVLTPVVPTADELEALYQDVVSPEPPRA